MKKIALTAALIALTGSAFAFQTEVIGSAVGTDVHEPATKLDAYSYGATVRVHAAPVKVKNLPIAEAAFLTGSSFAQVDYNHTESTGVQTLNAYGEYHYKQVFAGFGMGFNTQSSNGVNGYNGSTYTLGVVPVYGLSLSANYTNSQNTVGTSGKADGTWGVKAKYVKVLGSKAVNLEAGYAQGLNKNGGIGFVGQGALADTARKDDIYTAAADLYLTPKVSVGVTGEAIDSRAGNTVNVYGLRTTAFVTPNLSVGAFANHSDKNNHDFDQVGLNAGLHF